MGSVLFALFALAVSAFMTTLVNEDGEKVAAFLVALAAFAVAFFGASDGGGAPCDFAGFCY